MGEAEKNESIRTNQTQRQSFLDVFWFGWDYFLYSL